MRASRSEIFGHPNSNSVKEVTEPIDPKDLTSSRLQSELYCECMARHSRVDKSERESNESVDVVISVWRISGFATLFVHVSS